MSQPGLPPSDNSPTKAAPPGSLDAPWIGRGLLGLATVSWVALMVPLFVAGPLVLDEHGSYWILDSDLPGSMLRRSLDYAAIPPLSSWLQWASLTLFGKSEWAFRLPSAVCGLGGVWIGYLAGKEVSGARGGGLTALLLAWHPEAMDEVRIARCYGLVMLLGALVLWGTIRWRRSPESWKWAALWSLAAAALLWTHYTSALLVMVSGLAVAGSCLWHRQWSLRTFACLTLAAITTAILCLPLLPAILRLQEWGPYLNYSQSGAGIGDIFSVWWWAGLPLGMVVSLIIGGGWQRSREPAPDRLLVMVCGLMPLILLAGLVSGETSSLANPRYRVACAPAGACLGALLLSLPGRTIGGVAGAVVSLSIAWSLAPLPPWQPGRLGSPADQDWRELNRVLAVRSSPGDPMLVQSGLTEGFLVPVFAADPVFMEYVACRVSRFYVDAPHPRLALPFVWDPRTGIEDFYRHRLEEWRTYPGRVWVACATDTDLNRTSLERIQRLAQEAGYVAVEQEIWPNAALVKYEVPSLSERESAR